MIDRAHVAARASRLDLDPANRWAPPPAPGVPGDPGRPAWLLARAARFATLRLRLTVERSLATAKRQTAYSRGRFDGDASHQRERERIERERREGARFNSLDLRPVGPASWLSSGPLQASVWCDQREDARERREREQRIHAAGAG